MKCNCESFFFFQQKIKVSVEVVLLSTTSDCSKKTPKNCLCTHDFV